MTGERWERVAGQDRAVAALAARRRPGPSTRTSSWGRVVRAPTRPRVASPRPLIAPDDDERAWDLVLRGRHPDVVEIDPAGQPDPHRGRAGDHRRGVQQPHRGRPQGDHRVRGRAPRTRPRRTSCSRRSRSRRRARVIVLVTVGRRSAAAHDPVPVSARRLRVPRRRTRSRRRWSPTRALLPERADLARAARRRAHRSAPERSTGGSPVCATRSSPPRRRSTARAARSPTALSSCRPPCRTRSPSSTCARRKKWPICTAELEQAGYPDRVARAQLRRLADQQKRAHRHARTELLLEGITALETVYRDALAGPDAPALNADRPRIVANAQGAAAALDACRAAASGDHRAQPERDAAPRAAAASTCPQARLTRTATTAPTPRRYTRSPRRSSSDGRAAHS